MPSAHSKKTMTIFLDPTNKRILDSILLRYPYEYYAYGSRAKGTQRDSSDLDLCIMGSIDAETYIHLKSVLMENNELTISVDLIRWEKVSPEFQEAIREDLIPYIPSVFLDAKHISLTHALHSAIPSYSGTSNFALTITNDYDATFRCYSIAHDANSGTHIDFPAHIVAGAATSECYSLQNMSGPCVVLNLQEQIDNDMVISRNMLETFCHSQETSWENCWIALMTGWGRFWDNSAQYRNQQPDGTMKFPHLAEEAAQFLCEKKIKGVMIDTLDPDGSLMPFPVHKILLGNNILIIENIKFVSNLTQSRYYAIIAAIPIVGATESPASVTLLDYGTAQHSE